MRSDRVIQMTGVHWIDPTRGCCRSWWVILAVVFCSDLSPVYLRWDTGEWRVYHICTFMSPRLCNMVPGRTAGRCDPTICHACHSSPRCGGLFQDLLWLDCIMVVLVLMSPAAIDVICLISPTRA